MRVTVYSSDAVDYGFVEVPGPGNIKNGPWLARLVHSTWRERLTAEVPRSQIPAYLNDLQALVAGLREWREAQKVPPAETVGGLLTPLLREHAELTAGYITDDRFAEVVRQAMQARR